MQRGKNMETKGYLTNCKSAAYSESAMKVAVTIEITQIAACEMYTYRLRAYSDDCNYK